MTNSPAKTGSNKKQTKKLISEKLPQIKKAEQPIVPLQTISSFPIPEFIDAAEATDSGERGFSAFTKSQNMDNDTQTNFNIIDYEDFKQRTSLGSSQAEKPECTCELQQLGLTSQKKEQDVALNVLPRTNSYCAFLNNYSGKFKLRFQIDRACKIVSIPKMSDSCNLIFSG